MFYDDGEAMKAEPTHRELALGCGNVDSPQQTDTHSSGDKYCVWGEGRVGTRQDEKYSRSGKNAMGRWD